MVNSSSSLAISCATPPKTRQFLKSYKEKYRFPFCCIIRDMRKAVLTAGICILALGPLFVGNRTVAQTDAKVVATPTAFDEYGNLRECDHKARLDNFAIQLEQTPGSTAYVIVYSPQTWSKHVG